MDGEAQRLLAALLGRANTSGGWPPDASCRTTELSLVARQLSERLKPRMQVASARQLASIAE